MTDNQKRRIEDQRPGQPLEWDETDYLLGSPANAEHLAKSMAQAATPQQSELTDERIEKIWADLPLTTAYTIVDIRLELARAIEAEVLAQFVQAAPNDLDQVTKDEAELYRELTGDAMKLGYDGIPAALEALRVAQADVRAEPVGYARESELAKLADNRVSGVGMMIHKEGGEGKAALYLTAPTTPAQVSAAEVRAQALPKDSE